MLASAMAMQPLVRGGWWLPPSALVVLAIVLVGAVVRGLRWPAPLQPLLQAVTLLLALVLLFARDAARWGWLPGPAAISRLRDLAIQGREFADATVPPAGYHTGLLLLMVAGVGLVALVVDTLAGDLDLPGLTLIPLGALFVVPWVIGRGDAPWGAFVLVAVSWLAVLSSAQRARSAQWAPDARPGTPGAGLGVAVIAVGMALLVSVLPGLSGSNGQVPFLSRLGTGGGTLAVDAMVSLRRSLVGNDDRVVMTMTTTAERPDYLRLAVLETFDGEQWLPGPSSTLGSVPPPNRHRGSSSGALSQYQIEIGPLAGATVPSPPRTLSALVDWPVSWQQETSLPVRTDGRSVKGTQVELLVDHGVTSAADLRRDSAAYSEWFPRPEDSADPRGLVGDELPALAQEITEGAATPFDAALALQRWFTIEGGFRYSTDIEAGSGEDALTAFLEERVGYCEQFAATMALMARSLGIPARVVVGFTQGRPEDGRWVVRGTDAHAWPELWMGSAGWVRFEPTPGASTTTRPTYTVEQGTPYAGPTAAPTDGSSAGDESDERDRLQDDQAGAGTYEPAGPSGRTLAVLLGVLLVLMAPALVRLFRRVRRFRAARAGQAEPAYREVCDTLVDLGVGSEGATARSTMTAAVARVTRYLPDPELRAASDRILTALEWQRYGDGSPMPDGAPRPAAEGAAVSVLARPQERVERQGTLDLSGDLRTVRRALDQRATWPRRVRAALLPRSVLSGWARRFGGNGA